MTRILYLLCLSVAQTVFKDIRTKFGKGLPSQGKGNNTVVFRPTVRSLVTSGYERNRSGACHGSLGRSNRVTFYPKKESLSKK